MTEVTVTLLKTSLPIPVPTVSRGRFSNGAPGSGIAASRVTSKRTAFIFLRHCSNLRAEGRGLPPVPPRPQLPPEMPRKGRFDELLFVDLPNEAEREAI